MATFIVVNNPNSWPLHIPGVEVLPARSYLTDPKYNDLRGTKIFNLCSSYRYQSIGYYVSLLAGARGHKPQPSISTIQDLKSQTIIRFVSDDLDELMKESLAPIHSEKFTLNIYFGRNLDKRFDRLCLHLFHLFQAPLLRAFFVYNSHKWQLQNINAISASEIPPAERDFVGQVATEYFAGRRLSLPKRFVARYDMAILYNPAEKEKPSNDKAIQRFIKAAESLGIGTEIITKDDYSRLAEFDALFIRETTNVNHYTYRFARRGEAEGLVVIDDPQSIIKCTNKVYLAELLDHHDIPTPKTLIVHKDNVEHILLHIGLPCILKQPDSSFSQGVVKVETADELKTEVDKLLDKSELVIAQEFLPTDFDWRVGIFDQHPLYVCKYYMAPKHWQIIKSDNSGGRSYGKFETLPVEFAPKQVIRTALKAANLIGDGLYGVDLKQFGKQCYVIEVNDNPNIDAGVEDSVLKDELYSTIMAIFLKRIERRKERKYKP